MKKFNSTEDILDRLKLTFGETPEVFLKMLISPDYLSCSDFMRRSLSDLTLSPIDRQLLVYYFSFKNGSQYCTAIHHEILNMYGYDCSFADSEQDFYDKADDRITVLLNFAQEVSNNCGRVSEKSRAEFITAGFTEQNMTEVLLVANFALSVNQMSRFSNI